MMRGFRPTRLHGLVRGLSLSPRIISSSLARHVSNSAAETPKATKQPQWPLRGDDFVRTIDCMRIFQQLHGHFLVPLQYRVPKEAKKASSEDNAVNPWPQELHGYPLGHRLSVLLSTPSHRRRHPEAVSALRAMGIPIDVDWKLYIWEHITCAALKTYKEKYGHLVVPRAFVVPDGDKTWPKHTWGMRLGFTAVDLRQRQENLKLYQRQDLEKLEFAWHASEYMWSHRILPALKMYKEIYSNLHVPVSFVVPSEAPWPEKMWRLCLGTTVLSLRRAKLGNIDIYKEQLERDAQVLDDLGFIWEVWPERWTTVILPAIEAFITVYGERARFDRSFVVPRESPWPQQTWGLKLGSTIHNIRYGGRYRDQIFQDQERLKELGVFELLTEEWELAAGK
ncbi:hypothetical protein Poli38472_013395 [Pythium oligandrum]|uniref:Helicase-associated domain-containing protein n=1 Tax=Pythium oligandrum TaxID=41045 RepID=A0A8K1C797_PYTOL|nr:hypothetical protein Poli38472_013395 [Pythium oligandrum]|eukprot:TMW57921.1 hypothetical protein Poli38472_013395 [Pythium oligandrum]